MLMEVKLKCKKNKVFNRRQPMKGLCVHAGDLAFNGARWFVTMRHCGAVSAEATHQGTLVMDCSPAQGRGRKASSQ